jgi:RNA polymerase sigma-70 factor (ECF subfamily)
MSEEPWNKTAGDSVSKGRIEHFEETVLPHLNAAFNLARWLTRNEHDAEDVVQESYLRALHSFQSFQLGRDGRAWLLKIVRNTCYTWLRKNRRYETAVQFDEAAPDAPISRSNPEAALITKGNTQLVRAALERLSLEYRELLILRELEGFSYKEIAEIIDIPLGTVMSRLSRARKELHDRLCEGTQEVAQ